MQRCRHEKNAASHVLLDWAAAIAHDVSAIHQSYRSGLSADNGRSPLQCVIRNIKNKNFVVSLGRANVVKFCIQAKKRSTSQRPIYRLSRRRSCVGVCVPKTLLVLIGGNQLTSAQRVAPFVIYSRQSIIHIYMKAGTCVPEGPRRRPNSRVSAAVVPFGRDSPIDTGSCCGFRRHMPMARAAWLSGLSTA